MRLIAYPVVYHFQGITNYHKSVGIKLTYNPLKLTEFAKSNESVKNVFRFTGITSSPLNYCYPAPYITQYLLGNTLPFFGNDMHRLAL